MRAKSYVGQAVLGLEGPGRSGGWYGENLGAPKTLLVHCGETRRI
jgi:hypothetical protein